jgi:hypothetical protein
MTCTVPKEMTMTVVTMLQGRKVKFKAKLGATYDILS